MDELIKQSFAAQERRLEHLEHAVFGNGKKGIKEELVELKTEIQTFRKLIVWQIGIGVSILCAVLKGLL